MVYRRNQIQPLFLFALIVALSPADSFTRHNLWQHGRLSPSTIHHMQHHSCMPKETYDNHSSTLAQSLATAEEVPSQDRSIVSRATSRLAGIFHIDRKKFAKLGISFAVTYNIISNLSGSVTFSMAWYMASKRTGLSPLAAGQWRSLVTAYGSLYVFVTLMRPLRFALALTLTKHTEHFIEETQTRLGCTRATAIGLNISLGLITWMACVAGGVLLASSLSGVPIFE